MKAIELLAKPNFRTKSVYHCDMLVRKYNRTKNKRRTSTLQATSEVKVVFSQTASTDFRRTIDLSTSLHVYDLNGSLGSDLQTAGYQSTKPSPGPSTTIRARTYTNSWCAGRCGRAPAYDFRSKIVKLSESAVHRKMETVDVISIWSYGCVGPDVRVVVR